MDRPFYNGDCISLVLPVTDGMLGIQADHPPITAAIVPGLATFTLPDGTVRECVVSRGLFDISKNDLRILCESVISPEDIEDEKTWRMLEEAISRNGRGKRAPGLHKIADCLCTGFQQAENKTRQICKCSSVI